MKTMLRKSRDVPRARYYPVIDRMVPGDSGTVLVERSDLSTGEGSLIPKPGPTVWDLIDADGAIHGRVQLPSLFNPFIMHDNVIYGTHLDEDDIPSILGLRIIT